MIQSGYLDLLYALGKAFHKETLSLEEWQSMDTAFLMKLAKRHSVSVILSYALPPEAMATEEGRVLLDMQHKNLARTIRFAEERRKVCEGLEAQHVWYVPLKGILVNELYPVYGMREFADNDILYDATKQKEMIDVFSQLGYKTAHLDTGAHDVFYKAPFNFEMHRCLFDGSHGAISTFYEAHFLDLIQKDAEGAYAGHFSDEDTYVYLVAHAYKHYMGSGNGIRFLLDFYAYEKAKPNMDKDRVAASLARLEIADFEKTAKALAHTLFDCPSRTYELDTDSENMLSYILQSGTYGTMRNGVTKRLQKQNKGKARYLLSRLFPDMDWWRAGHPFVAAHPYLIPFYSVYRIFHGIFTRRKEIAAEVHIVREIDLEQMED